MSAPDDDLEQQKAELIETFREMDRPDQLALLRVAEFLAYRPDKDTKPLTKEEVAELFERARNLQ